MPLKSACRQDVGKFDNQSKLCHNHGVIDSIFVLTVEGDVKYGREENQII